MKILKFTLLALLISGIVISCSTSQKSMDAYSNDSYANMAESDKEGKQSERVILFSASVSMQVKNPDTTNASIEQIATKYKGYVHEIGTYRTIIRVKSEQLDGAIEEITTLGKVQHKSIKGQDVTEDYLDYQIRLENAVNARKRYLELLAKAENVQAALQVEKELERLNETIDILKGKINRLDHLSEYSTITIYLEEKKKPGVLGYVAIGIYRSIKWLFVRN